MNIHLKTLTIKINKLLYEQSSIKLFERGYIAHTMYIFPT